MTDQIEKEDPAAPGSKARFGRLIAKDSRDRQYMLPRRVSTRTFRFWNVPAVLDQGSTPQCVAYSSTAWLLAGPVPNTQLGAPHGAFAEKLYRECQTVDEWPGEDYDGTSVRAAFKIFKQRGYVPAYNWATDAEIVAQHILEVGPVVAGTWWKGGMMDPDDEGFIHATGGNAGGHAWLLVGFNRNKYSTKGTPLGPCFRMQNSWGRGWGQSGRAWITLPDLQSLIAEDGEACTATEVDLDLQRRLSDGEKVAEEGNQGAEAEVQG
jgi:C1A family cysteine protease